MAHFSKLLASRLAQQPPSGSHPDAGVLTAFTQNQLKSVERQSILTHLAACPDCREIVSLVSNIQPTLVPVGRNSNLRWTTAAALACTCVLVFTVTRPRPHVEKIQAPPALVSAITEPPPPAPTPAPKRTRAKKFFVPRAVPSVIPPPPPPPAAQVAELQREADRASAPVESFTPITLPSPPPPVVEVSKMQPAPRILSSAPQRSFSKAVSAGMLLKPRSLWSIQPGSGGTLSRSDDGGQTWISSGKTGILSLAVTQADIWAGSDSGTLFHSTDNGATWQQVTVSPQLTGPILSITRTGPQIRLKTKSTDWVSYDEGRSWQNELSH